jgi:hypothetical protein
MMTSVQLSTFIIHDHMYNACQCISVDCESVRCLTILTTGEKNASISTLIYTNGFAWNIIYKNVIVFSARYYNKKHVDLQTEPNS